MKVKVNSAKSVAVWKWNIDAELCSICRQAFDASWYDSPQHIATPHALIRSFPLTHSPPLSLNLALPPFSPLTRLSPLLVLCPSPDCKFPGDDCPPGDLSTPFTTNLYCLLSPASRRPCLTPLLSLSPPCLLFSLCAVFSGCHHWFHMHCIMKWLKTQQEGQEQCPLCRATWTFNSAP